MNVADLFARLSIKPDQRSFDAADKMLDAVKTALVGLAAIAGAHVLAGMVEDTVELGTKIHDLAQTAGISTDTLQELGYIAKLNSSDMESMAHAMGKLQNNMHAAAEGGDQQTKAFAKLGVRVTDVHGKLRPVEDVFEDIAINQKHVTNETEKGVAIFDTLGKSGRQLIPTMNDIADKGMANLIKEAHDLGAVMDEEAVNALDEFKDSQDRVKMGLVGLRNQAVIALLPELQKLADGFLEWIKTNKELIAQKLHVVLSILIKAIKGVASAVNFMITAFGFVEKHWDLIKVTILGLAAAMAIFQAKSIAAAVSSGAAWAMANLPLLFLAALITGVILLIDDLLVGFKGGNSVIKQWFEQRGYDWAHFQEQAELVAGATKAAFEAVFDFIERKLGWLIKAAAGLVGLVSGADDGSDAMKAQGTAYRREAAERAAKAKEWDAGEAHRDAVMAEAMRLNAEHSDSDNGTANTLKAYDMGVQGSPVMQHPMYGSSVSVTAPVTITVDGSKDPKATGEAVKTAMDDWFQGVLTHASSGVGGVR